MQCGERQHAGVAVCMYEQLVGGNLFECSNIKMSAYMFEMVHV